LAVRQQHLQEFRLWAFGERGSQSGDGFLGLWVMVLLQFDAREDEQ
jgi:hypothetical protein